MTKALLSQQIDAVQFAMWELHLYLDTHPDDISALALFKKYWNTKTGEIFKK